MARENINQNNPLNAPDYLAWHVTQSGKRAKTPPVRCRSSEHADGRQLSLAA